MNITTNHTRNQQIARRASRVAPQASPDQVTLYTSRRQKRKMINAASVLGGAALGSIVTANATEALTGTAAKIVGGASGALMGAAVVGLGGVAVAGMFSKDEGFGGLAGAMAGAVVGGVVGAAAGGYGGALLANGAGNVLGYAAGAIVGGTVGALTAKGINS